jgi:YggT family protein
VIVRIIIDILYAFVVILFARIILTWFPISPWSPWARIERGLARITEPVLRPLRRILPTVRFGSMGFDLSPIVVFFAIWIIIGILSAH